MAAYTVLSEIEIDQSLRDLPDWSYEKPNVSANFEFPDFRTAIAFICITGIEAEKMNHHPEFSNSYNKVSFSFCTHDAGYKVTDLDLRMAAILSAAARQLGG